MKHEGEMLAVLALQFALLSLVAIGGANSAMPEIHRQAVELRHWVSDREFSELYAIAQAAPGPNVMIVTLLGHVVAGPAGAIVATLAMCGPTCLLAYGVSRVFDRFKDAPWRNAIQAGLVPLTIGLIAATALILARAADRDFATLAITASTFALTYWTRITPLLALGTAAAVGALGFL